MKKKVFLKSFTLIETIVVIAVLGLVLPLIFVIIFALVREQSKLFRLSQVKREGDFILNTTTLLIRNNAVSLHSDNPPEQSNQVCSNSDLFTSSNGRLTFKDDRNDWFRIMWDPDSEKISSYSSSTKKTVDLNTPSTLIENFTIGCSQNSIYSPASVNIGFDICYKSLNNDCIGEGQEETALLHYQTNIRLRNF
ncbi:type II secretion system protein [Patescibacteria group bacterium]|nr:type II secretion system protein [Patescibacteria group bacterium]